MGVWIETLSSFLGLDFYKVTPFVGVWIETAIQYAGVDDLLSHPSWVCGLKQRGISI